MTQSKNAAAIVVCMALALVGCGAGKTKGAGAKSTTAAKSSNEKAGNAAKAAMENGNDQGSDVGGVTCDDSLEGVGVCASDTEIDFCSGGHWSTLDCDEAVQGSYCGLLMPDNEVDCWTDM